MLLTGLGFAGIHRFWPLLVVAVVGTLNPSAGDVSIFLPTEQTVLARETAGHQRTVVFAWYNVAGTLAGGIGALASGGPAMLARRWGMDAGRAEGLGFVLYAAAGLLAAIVYRRLTPSVGAVAPRGMRPLARSRRVVLILSALFSLDSFGGGFVVQSLLVLWLYRRFQLSVEATGAIFFAAGLAGALSQFVAPRLAARIGLIRTMAYTHLPANACLVLAGVVPSAPMAVGLLLVRALFSQMDVPARQAYVMAVVPPAERAAAASVTNVPRSLAAALPPLFTGIMLQRSSFGWPLVCGGLLKATYDLLLLARFRSEEPPAGS
jgi:predicted MFS family arabinose efflux permease